MPRLGELLARLRFSSTERMQTALALSITLHAGLLFGVAFTLPPTKLKDDRTSLDVVLVNAKAGERPLDALALAQANLDGGGNTDDDRRAKSPMPKVEQTVRPSEADDPQLEAAARKLAALEERSRQLMSQLRSQSKLQTDPLPRGQPEQADAPHAQPSPEQRQASERQPQLDRVREMARLEAQISKDWDEYQKRPKRKFVGARTEEYRFAQYVEDWRTQIERVGNRNYPEAARQKRLYGSLLMTVAIRADGRLENVEIVRSSGQRVLDAAALHIVELAAPFAPFPVEVRKDTDVLTITRTWSFTRADRLVSE